MGGHAFKGLYCPRISPTVYEKVKAQATAALQTVFAQVVVPTEMPGKVSLCIAHTLNSLTMAG